MKPARIIIQVEIETNPILESDLTIPSDVAHYIEQELSFKAQNMLDVLQIKGVIKTHIHGDPPD